MEENLSMASYNDVITFDTLPILEAVVYRNTLQAWVLAAIAVVLLSVVLHRLKKWVFVFLRKVTASSAMLWDDDLYMIVSRTRNATIIATAVMLATQGLVLGTRVSRGLEIAFMAIVFFQLVLWLDTAVQIALRRWIKDQHASDGNFASPKAVILSFLIRLVVSVIVLLLFLDNLGVNITALITGLGIGGIAVALAMQNILGDLFASLSIALDKPFEVGDFIVVGEVMGNVEKVGLKTTRIRSLSGEQIVFPNSDLLQSRVRNFKRMTHRRVAFRFGVTYDTSPEKIDVAGKIVRTALEADERARFERVHCMNFGASSLEFEVIYWVLSPEFPDYMEVHQSLMKQMLTQFKEAGIDFAFPTQTLLLGRAT
jgi:small-conductance mechanosensitive channel